MPVFGVVTAMNWKGNIWHTNNMQTKEHTFKLSSGASDMLMLLLELQGAGMAGWFYRKE